MKKFALQILLSSIFLTFSIAFGQLSGTYYIGAPGTGPGGSNPDYSTLKAACDAVISSGLSGDVIFYITSDLTEPTTVYLVNNSPHTITFKPSADADRTITFTKSSDNSASSGAWIFGLSSDDWTARVNTYRIVIDGYADGGSTRRLTIQTASTAHVNHSPIHLVGDVNKVTIKNCNINLNQTTGSSSFGAISMRSAKWTTDFVVDSITIDNCVINTQSPAGAGIFVTNTTAAGGSVPDTRPLELIFRNNIINVKHRAISLNYSGTSFIYNNQISVNQPASGFASFAIGGTSAGLISTNVYNNKIIQLATGNTGGSGFGIRGIQASGGGTWNIYNNFITGFSTPASGTTEVLGIRVGSASNIYYNTIVIPNLSTTGSGTQPTSGIVTFTAFCDIRNNIVITEEDDFATYCIYANLLPNVSDYNLLYRSGTTNANIGYFGANRATLSDWQDATGKDANSVSKAVNFVSTTDLHLTGASIGDNDLIATVLTGYTTDIDGNTRDPYYPYKGADEVTTKKLPSAFHTVSMSASLNNFQAFGNGSLIGSDGAGIDFFVNWDNTYLYLGWSGGNTNYSSDMYYAAIDTDPDGTNGTTNAIEGVGFLAGGPRPDYYVVYENNSSFYGVPASLGNAFEVYGVSGGSWAWISRTDGNDGTNSRVVFQNSGGEVRLRIPWSTLGGFTPGAGNKLGILMWNNNSSGNYMWARVPTTNPANGSTPITLTNYFVYSSTASGVNPASDATDTPLPVELVSFSANYSMNVVKLVWQTATEVNNYGWEIERSKVDEKTNRPSVWEKIGFVKGSGNSNSPKEYTFVDEKVLYGYYVYRLKQIDNDGSYSYSNELRIMVGNKPQVYDVKNYPNPFNPQTTIRFDIPKASNVKLQVYDITGQLVATLVDEYMEAGVYERIFDGSRLASGIYISVLQSEGVKVVRKMQLIK